MNYIPTEFFFFFIKVTSSVESDFSILWKDLLHYGIFWRNTFISNASLKLVKNLAKLSNPSEAKPWLFENNLLSASTLASKDNRRYSKNVQKQLPLTAMTMRLKIKSRSHRYNTNRPTARHDTNIPNINIVSV